VNWVDIAIVSSLISAAVAGLYWGLIRQVLSIFGLVGGIYFAGRLYEPVADFLHGDGSGLVADLNWARIIAFAGVVIGFSLVLGIVGSVLRFMANLLLLGWLDHLLGGVLGLATSLLLTTVMVVAATVFPVPGMSDAIKESQVAQWLSGFTPIVLAMLPPEFQLFQQLMTKG
jgi:membrane protein required for colicin V production